MKKRRTVRKRYAYLLLATVALIGAMGVYKVSVKQSIPTVETAVLSRITVEETAVCTGTVRAKEGLEVYTSVPCVVGDVAVEVGQRVEAGDVLLTVDRSATLALAVGAGLSEGQTAMASAALPQTVTAPADGVVSTVQAVRGETLDTSTPCVVLSEGGGVEIAVVIRESVLPKLSEGQTVRVSGVAFDKEVYSGVLSEISSAARSRVSGTTTETVVDAVVTLDPEDIDKSLLVGLTAKATVVVDSREDVLILPYECLTQNEDGQMAAYCLEGDTAVRYPVEAGAELTSGVEILGGLEEGAVVIKNPEQLTGDIVRVTVGEAM